MAKSLKALVRLHEWRVDEARRRVGRLADARDKLTGRLTDLVAEIGREKGIAQQDPQGAGRFFHAYMEEAARRENLLDKAIKEVEAEIEVARDALKTAYRELKTYQLTAENRADAARRAADKKEQEILDEIGQERYRRAKRTSN